MRYGRKIIFYLLIQRMGCAQDAEGCFFFDSIITAASSYNIGTGGFFSVGGWSLAYFLTEFPDKTGGIIVAERRADVLYFAIRILYPVIKAEGDM